MPAQFAEPAGTAEPGDPRPPSVVRRRSGRLSPLLGALPAVARRPGLWTAAVRQVVRLAPTGWWRRPPFLPLPAAGYLAFRLETMYGSPRGPVDPEDIVRWLTWCRDERCGGSQRYA